MNTEYNQKFYLLTGTTWIKYLAEKGYWWGMEDKVGAGTKIEQELIKRNRYCVIIEINHAERMIFNLGEIMDWRNKERRDLLKKWYGFESIEELLNICGTVKDLENDLNKIGGERQ